MNNKEEIEKRLTQAQRELDSCLNLLKPYELDEKHLLIESIAEGISHLSVAQLHFEKTSKRFQEPLKVKCSFCKKAENEVATIIQGPSVWICDECIKACNTTIESGEGKGEIA
jgi:hypothetical protein